MPTMRYAKVLSRSCISFLLTCDHQNQPVLDCSDVVLEIAINLAKITVHSNSDTQTHQKNKTNRP
jgi:hypothetical protein